MNRAKNIEGKHCGRPRGSKVKKEKFLKNYLGVAEDLQAGISIRKVAKIHGVSVNTVFDFICCEEGNEVVEKVVKT